MIRATAIALCNCVLQINQVRPPHSRTLFLPIKFFLTLHSPLTSRTQNNCTHLDSSSIDCSTIAESLISRCSRLLETKEKASALVNPSLKDCLLEISDVVPDYARRIRRISELTPNDVLELLLGFQSEVENGGIHVGKVECLWGFFKCATECSENFKHLPRSCEIMASLLIRVGKVKEVELLFSKMETEGIFLDNPEIFSCLVESFVGEGNLEGAISMYEKMRQRGVSPLLSCYCVLLESLVRMKKTQLALGICWDMVELGSSFGDQEKAAFENVVELLCWQGKVLEARNLVKKFVALGSKPRDQILYEITSGYCEKKDFEDLLSFFFEIKCPPDVISGNKIVHSLCRNFGSESANLFLRELELTGFKPDEITYGILISWSCCEGGLRTAFIYLSDLLLSGLKPDLRSYNALISGILKEGLWNHAQGILDEMVDNGITPNLSTFKILLAGYCKARQFDEAKKTILEMEELGLIQLSSVDDPLCRTFSFLGFDPLAVRLKRDSNSGVSKTEFFDSLGNGLYLEADEDEYEKTVTKILEESMLPDFNSLIIEECRNGDWEAAVKLADEMARWGQEPSSTSLMNLLKNPYELKSRIRPHMIAQLGADNLNVIVQEYSKKGLTSSGLRILNEMIQMNVIIEKETYSALTKSLCKRGNLRDLLGCLNRAHKDCWVPHLHDCKFFVKFLCKKRKVKEVVLLLEKMLVSYPHFRLDIVHTFLERLSDAGFAAIGQVLVEELFSLGFSLDPKAYELLIIGFLNEKNISMAINILDGMIAMNMVPSMDVSLLLIPVLCKAGQYEMAIALKETGTSELLVSSLIKGFSLSGKVREAITLFQDMLFNGFSPDSEIYNFLVQGHCKVKNFDKVSELLGVMVSKDLSLSILSYRKLVHLMCTEGRILQALHLKNLMLQHDPSHGLVIYNILIFYLFQCGNNLLVDKILDELQKRKLLLDEVMYNFLIYGFSRCKDLSSSKHYLFALIHQGLHPSNRSLSTVISRLCDIGELGKALELSREMESRGWIHNSSVQNAIVEGLIAYGRLQEAEYFVARMVEKHLIPKHVDYNNIIRQFCRHGKLSKAVDLINIMLKNGNTPRSTSYDSVIQCCCNCNKLQEAMDFHTEMLDRGLEPNVQTGDKLVISFCRNGQTKEAERLLNGMLQRGKMATKDAYYSLLNNYRLENNLKKASETMREMQQSGYEVDFETQWSLISNLSDSTGKKSGNKNNNKGFISELLLKSGFS